MNSLENMLEINLAILGQKNNIDGTLPKVVEALFKEADRSDIHSESEANKEKINEFSQEPGIISFKKEEKPSYSAFEAFKGYISTAANKIYGYYSKIKDVFSEMAGRVGYTDKLLKEFEDWGMVYFKTAFKKLQRLTPLGIMQRYLEELWIFVAKKIK